MANVNIRKRGKVYQYQFEAASVDGKRKQITKLGFKTKNKPRLKVLRHIMNILILGCSFTPSTMSVSDFLDYWIKNYCEINLKNNTIQAYKSIIKNHKKNCIGMYRLSQITPSILNELMTNIYVEKGFSKAFLKNILKVLKGSLDYASDLVDKFKKYATL